MPIENQLPYAQIIGWDAFFKKHPHFAEPNLSDIQQDVHPSAELVDLTDKYEHLPEPIRHLVNLKLEEEIEARLQHAADTHRFNTNNVHVILQQPLALYYMWKMYLNDKIDANALMRFTQLQEQFARQQHVIKKSTNTEKICYLRKLIDNGLANLNNESDDNENSFSELKELLMQKDFAYVLLGLTDSKYMQGLQMQQIYTLFQMYQLYQIRPGTNLLRIKNVQPIFAENGKVCEEIENLFPTELLTLIKTLPASEQIMITIDTRYGFGFSPSGIGQLTYNVID